MATDFNAILEALGKEGRTTFTSDTFANDVVSIYNPNGDPNNPNAIYVNPITAFQMRITEHLDGSSVASIPLSHEVQILNLGIAAGLGVHLEGDWAGASFQTAQEAPTECR